MTAADSIRAQFQNRVEEQQTARRPVRPKSLNVTDSIRTYFLPPDESYRSVVEQAMFRSTADYLTGHQGFFVQNWQESPMRVTAAPYGLQGNRLGVSIDRQNYTPWEHLIEPDGMIDLFDVPVAPDYDRYVVPAGLAALFSTQPVVASIVTTTREPDSTEPVSAFIVDQGNYGYGLTRGRLHQRWRGGREYSLSIGYHTSDGFLVAANHDSYAYTGRWFEPIGSQWGVAISGHLTDNDGPLRLRPDIGGAVIERNRFNRSLEIALYRDDSSFAGNWSLAYRYRKQQSHLNLLPFRGRYDRLGHGISLRREQLRGSWLLAAEITGDWERYSESSRQYERLSGEVMVRATHATISPLGLQIGVRSVEGWLLLPQAAISWRHTTGSWRWLLTARYAERVPSLEELNLERNELGLYSGVDYVELGNSQLKPERQAIASLDVRLGRPERSLEVMIAGGQIFDGIDWVAGDSSGVSRFQPTNGDIQFLSITGRHRWQLGQLLAWHLGGSLSFIDYEAIDDRPYTPERNGFAGLELIVAWPQKRITFTGYGELRFVGPYEGYSGRLLGNEIVANAKAELRYGSFRFHFVAENAFSNFFEAREFFPHSGVYNYFGFVWNFFD